jgi:hypothetical protein
MGLIDLAILRAGQVACQRLILDPELSADGIYL